MITVEVNKECSDNIFYKGNIVVSRHCIVQVSADNDNMAFTGQVIKPLESYERGDYSESWAKESFSQFTGTITITSK